MDEHLKDSIERAADALKDLGAREVYVFGSAASGRTGAVSDVDLAVSGLPPEVFFQAMARARDILGRDVDLVCLEDDNPFTRYLKDEGELERVA
ncbi:MAG: nucleotidyltransferase domain-containing protein [bacterium]